jgi:hypothetical protein
MSPETGITLVAHFTVINSCFKGGGCDRGELTAPKGYRHIRCGFYELKIFREILQEIYIENKGPGDLELAAFFNLKLNRRGFERGQQLR